MRHLKNFVPAILISFCITMGVAEATPLATFARVTAQDYINFPFGNQNVSTTPPQVSGVLLFTQPTRNIFAMGSDYTYDSSLIAYFTFTYWFVSDDGVTVFHGQEFNTFSGTPTDYINLGRIPGWGLPYTQSFDSTALINAFNSKYR
jgi:hypothetical protein